MELRCTCGAVLPEDARFCHKCGKPQYEEDLARLSAEAPTIAPTPESRPEVQPAPTGISFRDSRAVAISILAAGGAFFGSGAAALISPLLWPLVPLAAGFVAALLYKLASHQPLSTANGARLGWMTGLWLFFVFMIVLAAVSLYIASPVGEEAVKRLQSMPQFANLSINSPHDLLMTILASAIPTFLLLTVLPGLGGMLGAKLSARR